MYFATHGTYTCKHMTRLRSPLWFALLPIVWLSASGCRQSADDAVTHYKQGFALQLKGEYDRALDQYNQALERNPAHALSLKNRGRIYFYRGDFGRAAADLQQGLRLDPTNAYVVIWLHMARQRQGIVDSSLRTNAVPVPTVPWPAPVIQFYLGHLTAGQLMAAAAHTDPEAQTNQRCAAAFYIGEAHLWQHQPAEAVRQFQITQADCPRYYTEYHAAVIELARLSGGAPKQ
jgi:lipoprotein NlpI